MPELALSRAGVVDDAGAVDVVIAAAVGDTNDVSIASPLIEGDPTGVDGSISRDATMELYAEGHATRQQSMIIS